jgi:glycosyltransferase involved in cell wall biosynthesis
VAGNAGLYVDPNNVEDIADKLCLLYKNEHLRSQLMANCAQQAAKFSWNKSAIDFYNCMMNAYQNHKK